MAFIRSRITNKYSTFLQAQNCGEIYRMISLILFAALISSVAVAADPDYECTRRWGKCYDYRYKRCWAEMATGLCKGDENRRCCMYCPSHCKMNEHIWYIFLDYKCLQYRGICQYNSNYCAGTYMPYPCGGPRNRQCCLHYYKP